MATQLAQNQQMYNDNPVSYEMENIEETATPEQMDAVISQMNGAIEPEMEEVPGVEEGEIEGLDMPSQEGAYTSNLEGMTPEMGSLTANPNALI